MTSWEQGEEKGPLQKNGEVISVVVISIYWALPMNLALLPFSLS